MSVITYCPGCGQAFNPARDDECPQCSAAKVAVPEVVYEAPTKAEPWGIGAGLLALGGSVALLIAFQIVAVIIYFAVYFAQHEKMPEKSEIDWLLAVLSLALTFPAHLLTVLVCWTIATGRGRQPFLPALGWDWHPQFKWMHAVALSGVMMGSAYLLAKYLPHHETELERLLKLGAAVRVLTALLAVATAPLVEEFVYRGLLYTPLERKWGKAAGITIVSLLFALVHVPQYWGSAAAIATILLLSVVLTGLRAATGKLLPCVATHFIYNGLQSIGLLFFADAPAKQAPTETALSLWRWFGMG